MMTKAEKIITRFLIFVVTMLLIVLTYNKIAAQTELLMPNDGFWYEFDTDDALLYDDGYQGNYANNGLGALTIYPLTPGGFITLSFLFMDIEENSICSWDYLEVYHGENFDSLVGRYCGTNLPPVMTSTDPTGSFTLLWSTDGSVTRQGFIIQTKLAGFPLPIDLVYFEAEYKENKVDIEWMVASEVRNDYFEVQRSINCLDWEVIAKLDGLGTHNFEVVYNYIDYEPLMGVSYYRLKQVDFDDKFEVFHPVSVIINKEDLEIYKTINLTGQEVDENYKGIVIDIYSNGTMAKRIQ
jgi:hypothetical protein